MSYPSIRRTPPVFAIRISVSPRTARQREDAGALSIHVLGEEMIVESDPIVSGYHPAPSSLDLRNLPHAALRISEMAPCFPDPDLPATEQHAVQPTEFRFRREPEHALDVLEVDQVAEHQNPPGQGEPTPSGGLPRDESSWDCSHIRILMGNGPVIIRPPAPIDRFLAGSVFHGKFLSVGRCHAPVSWRRFSDGTGGKFGRWSAVPGRRPPIFLECT